MICCSCSNGICLRIDCDSSRHVFSSGGGIGYGSVGYSVTYTGGQVGALGLSVNATQQNAGFNYGACLQIMIVTQQMSSIEEMLYM